MSRILQRHDHFRDSLFFQEILSEQYIFLYTQAMAVYGQLARPSSPNDDTPNDPDNRRSTQPPTNSSELSQNNKTVDSPRSKSEAGTGSKVDAREHDVFYSEWKQVPSSSEPPHFTAATSPTRKRDFM